MGKILVLGGAGFIGFHLTRFLAENSANNVVIVDNQSRGQMDEDLKALLQKYPSIEFMNGDLTAPETFDKIGGSYDAVYLLAGIVGVRSVEERPSEVIRVNTLIILNTLGWWARTDRSRLLFASTSETYAGAVERGIASVPTGEDAPLAILDIRLPRYSYAVTKMWGEAAVTHYARQLGREAVIVRYHNIYGPRMGFGHVVPELMERIHHRMDPLPVYGLEQTRAFCYVDDAVAATHALMNCALKGCEIVHVGNPTETSVRQLTDMLLEIVQWRPKIRELPAPAGGVNRRCPAIGKLQDLTGFRPRVDLKQGLAMTWRWYEPALKAKGKEPLRRHR